MKSKSKFGAIDIALTIIGGVIYGLAAFATMNWAIGFITLRPLVFVAPLWGIFFGPWVGGLAGLIGNTFISDILAGWFGIGGVGGAVGNFMLGFLPGLMVKDAKNWKSVILWAVVATLICAVAVGGWIALMGYAPFWTLFSTVLIADIPPNVIILPILSYYLVDRVRKMGLYYPDRVQARQEAVVE
ncbi:MAG: ECF transporter S component [Chloroflexota bacterium]|nr:ECF transporter S component [Chloroflexota bacterium]